MAIVVEILAKNNQSIQHYYFAKPTVSVGRAYDNDIRLEDPYVCPHHLTFSAEDDEIRLLDNNSLNGVKVNGAKADSNPIKQSDVVTLGRSRIRVFSPKHALPNTLSLSPLEENLSWLGNRMICAFLLAAVCLLVGLNYYVNTFTEVKLVSVVSYIANWVVMLSLWPFAFALLSKLAKKETHVISQFSLLWLFLLGNYLLGYIITFLQFNLHYVQVVGLFSWLVKGVLFFALLWFALFLGFHQSSRRRNIITFSATGALATYFIFKMVLNVGEFTPIPSYNATLLPPMYQVASPSSTADFVEKSSALFDDLSEKEQTSSNK